MGERPIAADVTVVVPTVGRELMEGCLDSIAAGTVWPAEVIVVDQGGTALIDPWIDRLSRSGLSITHVRSEETGIAAGTNRGLERVRTPFVATTHDDCRVRADWLETISKRVPTIGDAILTGRVEPEGHGLVLTIVTSADPRTYTKPLIDRDVLFPPNMAFPIRVLERIGYLDEHPSLRLAGEDNEWAYRALRGRDPDRLRPGGHRRASRVAGPAAPEGPVPALRQGTGELLRQVPASRRSVHPEADASRPPARAVARPAWRRHQERRAPRDGSR